MKILKGYHMFPVIMPTVIIPVGWLDSYHFSIVTACWEVIVSVPQKAAFCLSLQLKGKLGSKASLYSSPG